MRVIKKKKVVGPDEGSWKMLEYIDMSTANERW